jgi:hypothetical protein
MLIPLTAPETSEAFMSPETEIKRERVRARERERAFQSLFKEKESWMPKAERWISRVPPQRA